MLEFNLNVPVKIIIEFQDYDFNVKTFSELTPIATITTEGLEVLENFGTVVRDPVTSHITFTPTVAVDGVKMFLRTIIKINDLVYLNYENPTYIYIS